MKSKTRRILKNSPEVTDHSSINQGQIAQALAIGHRPSAMLTPQDETMFRAFQSNLLSLISHELRTPLAGILNALGALNDGVEVPGLTMADLIKMAHSNAIRLNEALSALLDLAALESGTFHLRLKEVDLCRLLQSRLVASSSQFTGREIKIEWNAEEARSLPPVLADPQRLGRVLDLCFQTLVTRAKFKSLVKIQVLPHQICIQFELDKIMENQWETAWTQSVVGLEGGVSSPFSAFAGVMQSEEAFLARAEEGLGSEFLLIHEIMRIHNGKFNAFRKGSFVTLQLELPELSSEAGLRAVLKSRAFQISTELGSVGLILIQAPATRSSEADSMEKFRDKIKKLLFRSSDAVYLLPTRRQVALVLDDCKLEDAPQLMSRIQQSLGIQLSYGMSHCPTDGLDPAVLLEVAERRLELSLKK